MSVAARRELEARVVMTVIRSFLAAGYRLSVSLERGYDHEEMKENGVLGTTDLDKLMGEAFAGDDCHLFVHEAEGPLLRKGSLVSIGWVYFVMGNDGYDVMSDYSTVLEPHLKEAEAIADYYMNMDWKGPWWHNVPMLPLPQPTQPTS